MKRIFTLILSLLCLFTVGGCGKSEKTNGDAYFTGKVIEILEDRCLVEVTDIGNQNFTVGEKIFVGTNFKGCPKIALDERIKVQFDGCMALSYPPLVFRVYKIEKV